MSEGPSRLQHSHRSKAIALAFALGLTLLGLGVAAMAAVLARRLGSSVGNAENAAGITCIIVMYGLATLVSRFAPERYRTTAHRVSKYTCVAAFGMILVCGFAVGFSAYFRDALRERDEHNAEWRTDGGKP